MARDLQLRSADRARSLGTVYRWNADYVYRKSTERRCGRMQTHSFRGISAYQGYYHQQYLAKNPNGYCGIGGCGVPFKIAELQVGEKA